MVFNFNDGETEGCSVMRYYHNTILSTAFLSQLAEKHQYMVQNEKYPFSMPQQGYGRIMNKLMCK